MISKRAIEMVVGCLDMDILGLENYINLYAETHPEVTEAHKEAVRELKNLKEVFELEVVPYA